MLVELLREGKVVRFTARGSSMWPAVRDGARVEVVPCDGRSLEVGALGAFEGERGIVVHRVVAVTDAGLRFRGDARSTDDGVVPWARVLGRAAVCEAAPWRLRAPSWRHAVWTVRAVRSWLRRRVGRT